MNRLLSKGMSNIYLEVTIETFSKLQKFSTHADVIEF